MSDKKTSIAISGLAGLEYFGIKPLTGEACAYSQRVLCDVNEAGRALLAEYFGIPDLVLARPMNSTVESAPSVGSLMLTRDSWVGLAKFAVFYHGGLAYTETGVQGITGIFCEKLLARYEEFASSFSEGVQLTRNHARTTSVPHVGSRNMHQMTGRVM
jgi:hypothetical protein